MDMSTVIKVESLAKKYLISHRAAERNDTFRSAITDGVKNIGRRILHPFGNNARASKKEEFWALKDVAFEIKQGDRLGSSDETGLGNPPSLKFSVVSPNRHQVVSQ